MRGAFLPAPVALELGTGNRPLPDAAPCPAAGLDLAILVLGSPV